MSRIRRPASSALLLIATLPLLTGIACGGGDDSGDCTINGAVASIDFNAHTHSVGAAFSGTAAHPPAQGHYNQAVGAPGRVDGEFVINQVTLPQQRNDYAIDLNGDGRVDNQWGNIIGALSGQAVFQQAAEDQAVANGTATELLRVASSDASLQSDDCASTAADRIDPSASPSLFVGPLKVGKFSTAAPATTKRPVTMDVHLFGFPDVLIHLIGAHMQYTVAPGPPQQLVSGQINGAVKESELRQTLIPAIARFLNREVQTDGTGTQAQQDQAKQIKAIFDVGGNGPGGTCTDPDYSPIDPGDGQNDGVISPCEVATANLIKNVLSPDVQMFDAAGNYAPNPHNTTKDSLSIGVGFTAVPGSF